MQALSLDLRERIVEAYEAGEGSYEAIAERFSVGPTRLLVISCGKSET